MATEREKEREAELESAMYTNCLLLGLDPPIIGGSGGASPRAGHFRHSNPRMGEQLLYFLLSALRGPVQSAKDFDKVWPIFDSSQSRDFRKIVQGIISELESQGALPRSNSRVSSLATCCGPRFVELLWQLSVHALREVHRRTFAADVAANPLPASLTDISYLHAAALLPVTKARIALERRKFLKNANTAVHRQIAWSNLAHEMTAEFRGLCAEEAYLQQELEKLHDMRNKAKLEEELWDERISSSSSQNSHLISKATRLWESLLARKSQHEVLASGPIEDLIAHREHRYRISGSSLLAAMDLSSQVPCSDGLSVNTGEKSPCIDSREHVDSPRFQRGTEILSRADDRNERVHPNVDVAEILRRWTHALQRIHKQSLHLAKANDGEGPEIFRCPSGSGSSSHDESLSATLAEHRQHVVSIQGLINQLKEALPAMQKSIADLTQEVNSSSVVAIDGYARLTSPTQAQSSGRLESNDDVVADMTSKLSSVHIDKASASPALKLPHLFTLTPNSSVKSMRTPKRPNPSLTEGELIDPTFVNDHSDGASRGSDSYYVKNLRRSVREAALSRPSIDSNWLEDHQSDDESEHFFIPHPMSISRKEVGTVSNYRKQRLIFSPSEIHITKSTRDHPREVNTRQPIIGLDDAYRTLSKVDESLDQVFSPSLMDSSFLVDTYEDLLAPLSETDAALIGR